MELTHPYSKPGINYSAPEPVNASREVIEEFVDYFIDEKSNFNFGDELEELALEYGGRIRYVSSNLINATDSGSILVHGKLDFDIYIPIYGSFLRNRFTIAHEIGHMVLHSHFGKTPLMAARSGRKRFEYEANYFAAALLMPAKEVTEKFSSNNGNLNMLSSIFRVSTAAMNVRLKVLKLV